MADLISLLQTIETELLERQRQAKEQKREAAAEERRLAEQLGIVRAAKEGAQNLGGSGVAPDEQESARRSVPTVITDPSDEDYGFVWPALNPQTREPIYDPRVVTGYNSHRERAYGAARVYGRQLREGSLADAIFEAGETGAVSASSARSSLGSVVRYGHDWTRLNGWLYYSGDLECDVHMVCLLVGESAESVCAKKDG